MFLGEESFPVSSLFSGEARNYEKIFTLSIVVSQLEEKVSILSSELAIRSHSAKKEIEHLDEEEKEGKSHAE